MNHVLNGRCLSLQSLLEVHVAGQGKSSGYTFLLGKKSSRLLQRQDRLAPYDNGIPNNLNSTWRLFTDNQLLGRREDFT